MHRRISAIALAIVLVTVCLRAQSVLNVPSSTHPTIQAAVTAAQAGDTIQIAPGNYLEAVVVTGKSLIIQGAGAGLTTIDGLGVQRCLELGPGPNGGAVMNVLLRDISLSWGFAAPASGRIEGGGLLVHSGVTEVRLERCEISNCLGDQGCGIQVDPGPKFYLLDCNLHDNGWWPLPGGATLPAGGALRVTTDLHATGCVFADNQMPYLSSPGIVGRGGAVALASPQLGSTPLVLISACRFLRNRADQGGAIHGDADAYLKSSRSRYEDNLAAQTGGAVRLEFATLVNFDRDLFAGNDALGLDKVLDVVADRAYLNRCTVAGNATANSGSRALRIRIDPSPSTSYGILSVHDLIVSGNGNDVVRYEYDPLRTAEVVSTIYSAQPEYVHRLSGAPLVPATTMTATVGFTSDPGFVDEAVRDFHLRAGSLAIDRGSISSALPPALAGLDLDGNPAIVGPWVDIGCYEVQNRDPGPAWAGSVPDGSGGTFDSLTINGGGGGLTRSVLLPVSSPITIGMAPAPGEAFSHFVLYGYLGLPRTPDIIPVPFAQGSIIFAPQPLVPFSPAHLTFADSTGAYAAIISAPPAPWSISGLTSPVPARLTLQAFQTVGATDVRISNAIVIDAQ
ncbi:MAG: hypothetical protein H6807_11505 [Planctomycetes bacterium]|nr:hypothetical protein [Planctomycetota bacterium]